MPRKALTYTVAPAALFASLTLAAMACNNSRDSAQAGGVSAQSADTNPNAPITVRGTVVSVSANQLVVRTDTGAVTVAMIQPFRLYARVPADLSAVKEKTFIGVTTVKQPDGSERATEIHVFPEELRGLGEGSRMMAPGASGGSNRMTNGNVSTSRMTNGSASPSRMSNGSVASTNGSSLVVEYAGGSQTVTVPPNTPVTELKAAARQVTAGDQVAVIVTKAADGSLSSDKAISTAR